MAHWLMKSEPHVYSWDDLVRDGGTEWDGVRNNAARLHLRAMKVGDEAFFYHSGEERAVGPVTLKDIKGEPKLAKMELIRQSRLSVSPVREEEWALVLKMGGKTR